MGFCVGWKNKMREGMKMPAQVFFSEEEIEMFYRIADFADSWCLRKGEIPLYLLEDEEAFFFVKFD
jgi:hypothetical protein